MDEELHHQVPVVDKLLLEIRNGCEIATQRVALPFIARLGDERRRSLLLALVLPGVVRALMLLAYLVEGQVPEFGVEHVLRRGRVPAAIVECDVAPRTEFLPELLHDRIKARHAVGCAGERAGRFDIEILRHGHGRRTRIEIEHEVGDAAALAGAVPALEQDNETHALLPRLLLQNHELLHELVATNLVLLFRQRFQREIHGFQHGSVSPLPRSRPHHSTALRASCT